MAAGIVDMLEMIDVDHHDAEGSVDFMLPPQLLIKAPHPVDFPPA
jgi:hypothetical protein